MPSAIASISSLTLETNSHQPARCRLTASCWLTKHYGFTDEELDFIINYDIKYRMEQNGAE